MDKKFIYSMILSTATVLGFQYYFSSKEVAPAGQFVAGQAFKAPISNEVRPLNREIDFIDHEAVAEESITTLENDHVNFQFSNHGGTLVGASFKKHRNKDGQPLATIVPGPEEDRDQRAFLLVMGTEAAPYNYKVIDQTDASLTYEAQTGDWRIQKTYSLNRDSYRFDVEISVEPRHSKVEAAAPRLFVSGPFVGELIDNTVQGFVTKTNNASIEKVSAEKELEWFWASPGLVGSEDRYFAHGLAADQNNFVKRAYFKRAGFKFLQTVLEGPSTQKKESWKLSFYMGPKLSEDLCAVDTRLEGLLSFGWLSIICKLLLALLGWLYGLLHNYGFVIIALTALIKLPFVPLMIRTKRRMEEYQRYQPTINLIRAKYRNDVQKQHEELMRFHKEHNLSPTTQIFGCLPLLVQMPIFFALYRVLSNYLALYQAPFVGWITDLSAKDPYYILPVLMGLTMLIQQLNTPVTDEKQRFVMLFMPLVLTAVFVNFPAGLVLYWFVNNLLSMFEDALRRRFFA